MVEFFFPANLQSTSLSVLDEFVEHRHSSNFEDLTPLLKSSINSYLSTYLLSNFSNHVTVAHPDELDRTKIWTRSLISYLLFPFFQWARFLRVHFQIEKDRTDYIYKKFTFFNLNAHLIVLFNMFKTEEYRKNSEH